MQITDRLFQALVERSYDGIALLAADGITLYVTPAASRVLGYPAEESTGRHCFDRVHPGDVPRCREQWDWLLAHPGERVVVEFRHRQPDGSWKWLEVVGTNRLHEPEVRSIVANFRDVTERRQQQALRTG